MLPSEPASSKPRAHWTGIVALVMSVFALVAVVADGACRPEPVPVSHPAPEASPPVSANDLKTSDPGEVRP